MGREKWFFSMGLIAGAVLVGILLLCVAPRYTVVQTGDKVIRQDMWSGKTWCLVNDTWKTVSAETASWEDVDRILAAALSMPYVEVDTVDALRLLREEYPLLKEVPTPELLTRIKAVYSSKLLSSLYLKDFVDLQRQNRAE